MTHSCPDIRLERHTRKVPVIFNSVKIRREFPKHRNIRRVEAVAASRLGPPLVVRVRAKLQSHNGLNDGTSPLFNGWNVECERVYEWANASGGGGPGACMY